jgi:hypothetical protein
VAALAQNGDGLRADQARAADDDDPDGLPFLRRLETLNWARMQVRKISGPQRACSSSDRPARHVLPEKKRGGYCNVRGACSTYSGPAMCGVAW